MATFRKIKGFEQNIPSYAFSKVSDIMLFTYVHAYYAVFPTRSIQRAVTLFMQDFKLEATFDIDGAMVCYQRVRERFLDEQRRDYESSEIADIHIRGLLDVMVWAWVTFLKKHVHEEYEVEQAIILMNEYFSLRLDDVGVEMYERRYRDNECCIIKLPTVPMDFNMLK